MKKTIIILAIILMGVSGFAQVGTVKALLKYLTVETVIQTPPAKILALQIWNASKDYARWQDYTDNNSGVYPVQYVRYVWKHANKIMEDHLVPFMSGSLVREGATFDAEGNELTPVVYWSVADDKLAYRNYWRANYEDQFVLDIVRIYLDFDSEAF